MHLRMHILPQLRPGHGGNLPKLRRRTRASATERCRSADLRVCCVADFQSAERRVSAERGGLEIRDTADSEVCATRGANAELDRDVVGSLQTGMTCPCTLTSLAAVISKIRNP